jgi:menaquinone-dependent protoporphyrinogen IX oxidase
VKVLVVYDTKHGNTKLVAEKIVEGIEEVEGTEVVVTDVKEVDLERVTDFDAIVIGSPNHIGRPARSIEKFIDELGKVHLKAQWVAVFDTYLGRDFEKVVKKMEKKIGEKVPSLKLLTPGLSIRVDGMEGPITEGELPKCKDFGKKIANQLEKT